MDPFTLLAIAKGAVTAIKSGCELYKEFKGQLVEVKETFDEVKGIAEEVGGFWGTLKNFFGNKEEQQSKPKPKPIKKELQEFDEVNVRRNISDNLVKFFKALEQLKAHIRDEEEKSKSVYDPDQNMLEAALNRVMAMDEMEKLQYEIRQIMVYETPGMGDLYTRVIRMVGVISEEQEFARLQKIKKEKDAAWKRRLLNEKIQNYSLIVFGAALVAAYIGLMWWTIAQDRMIRWGF